MNETLHLGYLPIEVSTKIASYLPVKDISSLSQVSKNLYEATQLESLWKHKCGEDFNIKSSDSNLSYKELYTKLLYPYGKLIGLWHTQDDKVVRIQYCKGDLKCTKCLLRLEFLESPDAVNYFTITLNSKKDNRLIFMEDPKNPYNSLELKNSEQVATHLEEVNGEYYSIINETSFDLIVSRDHTSFKESKAFKKKCERKRLFKRQCIKHLFKRITIPEKRSNVPIQPGVFIGTYGSHGLEYIMLDYSKDCSIANAVKITGDPNVPAGATTFKAYINQSISLTGEDQDCLEPEEAPYNSNDAHEEPFLPPSTFSTDIEDFPDKCKARFRGEGQVAGTGFTNHEFIQGHWVVFNENLFAFLWFNLCFINFYRRADELFS